MTLPDVEETSFDICGDLPSGTTVLEASAGTGKTYTIAALAARYLAEGHVQLSDLMMVTFSRMATDELRTRVRDRLIDCEQALAKRRSGRSEIGSDDDPVRDLLCSGSPAEIAARHDRIRAALADFDAATIATTHQFCQTMLNGLGVLADQEPDATFTQDLSDLSREIAADCYLHRFAPLTRPPPVDFDAARRLAREVVGAPDARLVPAMPQTGEEADSDAAQRYGFAVDVRAELDRRKQRHKLYSFDDMLSRLQSTLTDPVHGEIAAERLRQQFRVVLVDEFQDTDPVQWDILRRAFAGHATLILIGDPKQAIYAFRGADVYCYLDAVRAASTMATLDTNWRSDAALTEALNALFGRATLGDPRIGVRPVRAHHQQRRLLPPQESLPTPAVGDGADENATGPDGSAKRHDEEGLEPLRIRVEPYDPETDGLPRVADVRRRIRRDLVNDIDTVLSRRAQIGQGRHRRTIEPSDIAVLVRQNRRAEEIRDALTEAGIPAVVLGANSVYASDLAQEWLTLLSALEQPRQALIRAAALTRFIGWTMHDIATASETDLTNLAATLRRWQRLLATGGVATLLEAIGHQTRLTSRLLSVTGGERDLTDLRHIGQALHAAASTGQLGISALRDWLRQRVDEAQNTSLDERSRRLESDAEAVQILTVHRSKGLEFPVVYLPDAWDRFTPDRDKGEPLRLHDDPDPDDADAGEGSSTGPLALDVGGSSAPGRRDRLARNRREDSGDDLRLAYVAFTRAQLQVVTWWAPSVNTPASALQRLLYRSRAPGQTEPAQRYEITSDPLTLPQPGDGVSIERMDPPDRPRTRDRHPAGPEPLSRRRFDRSLDLDWRRTSYTALTAAVTHAGPPEGPVGSETEPGKEDDETLDAGSAVADEPAAEPDASTTPVSPMDTLPTGADFGTVVHAVLERVDPGTADIEQTLESLAAEELARLPAQPMTATGLAEGIRPTLETPLGPLAGDRRLTDIGLADRLTELSFELPLAGGDHPRADVRLGEVAGLVDAHLPGTDPLTPYASMLAQPGLAEQPLRGFLTGSIDAVLRVRDDNGRPRYLVADYKTNWLGPPDQRPLRVSAYHPDRLPAAMMAAHYPLQALLYSVALHRFLRWRQPDYRPADHLGGILYLFVRGLAGPDTPRPDGIPTGVFSWQPPPGLITDLSDLLDHGRTATRSTAHGGVRP